MIRDLDAWTTGVLFPVAVLVIAALLGWIARCGTRIAGDFSAMRRDVRRTKRDVRRMKRAMIAAGLMDDDDDEDDEDDA